MEKDQEPEQIEEQMSELIEDPVHSGEKSLFWGVQSKDIIQKLDKRKLPFQVKHHTRPPDFISFFAGTTGGIKFKEVAQSLNAAKIFPPPYRWKRPFKSNAHGIVFNQTSKTTLTDGFQSRLAEDEKFSASREATHAIFCNFYFHIL